MCLPFCFLFSFQLMYILFLMTHFSFRLTTFQISQPHILVVFFLKLLCFVLFLFETASTR
ncbi:mCG1029839 [Mus musculus]|nr:mCG1029839 [Mus musculus]